MQRKRKPDKDGVSKYQNSTMPDNIERIFFIEPNDEEFKLTMKAARRKLEVPMPAAMLCKNTEREQWRNPPQCWETQDKIRLCC